MRVVFEAFHFRVESGQVVAEPLELGVQCRDAAFVGGDGDETRIVELAARRVAAGGKRLAQPREFRSLLLARRGRRAAGIDAREPAPCVHHERGGVVLARRAREELLERARRPSRANQRSSALGLDDHRKSLVEVAVAGRIGRLVRELVEDEGGELGVAVAEHGVQHRVAQVAERRIGDGRTDPGVEAARAQFAAARAACASSK